MRLIDANALAEKAYWHGEHPSVDHLFTDGVDAVDVSDIEKAPTIEAEPVRHGRWIKGGYVCGESEFICSVCGESEWRTSSSRMKYCMFCGAKMDGGADDVSD